jgi:AAA family ATPase
MLSDLLCRVQHTLSTSDISSIADILHGYLAGDISSLLSEAQRICWASVKSAEDSSQSDQSSTVNAKVTVSHLRAALLRIRPSGASHDAHSSTHIRYFTFVTLPAAMQGTSVENPNVKWSDIGGQEQTKRALQEAVEWPITHKAAFRRLGISPPKGAFVFANFLLSS